MSPHHCGRIRVGLHLPVGIPSKRHPRIWCRMSRDLADRGGPLHNGSELFRQRRPMLRARDLGILQALADRRRPRCLRLRSAPPTSTDRHSSKHLAHKRAGTGKRFPRRHAGRPCCKLRPDVRGGHARRKNRRRLRSHLHRLASRLEAPFHHLPTARRRTRSLRCRRTLPRPRNTGASPGRIRSTYPCTQVPNGSRGAAR